MALAKHSCFKKYSKNATENSLFVGGSQEKPHSHIMTTPVIWKRLLTKKHNKRHRHWIPALSGIVKAGDEGLYSSMLFTTPNGPSGQLSYERLLELFASHLRARSIADRSAYSIEVSQFLSTNRGRGDGNNEPGMVRSQSYEDRSGVRTNTTSRIRRKSGELSTTERGISRSMSINRPTLASIPMSTGLVKNDKLSAVSGSWMKDGAFSETCGGETGTRVAQAELVALSLILGSALNLVNSRAEAKSLKQGALGISISLNTTEVGEHQVVLNTHERGITQLLARGSGFSPLFAKHFAFGSLPFSQDEKTVRSVLITDETVEVIQAGSPFFLQPSSLQTLQCEYLSSLPHSREPTFYMISSFCTVKPSAVLISAIASLPFTGGLTPLAFSPLVAAVRFVASGGLPPGRLLQRLEGLVDKVDKHSPQLDIFGPLYEPHNAGLLFRERERLGKLATNTITSDLLADKVARVHRYTLLLERLMALIPNTKSQDVLAAVQEASRKEMQHSYADAVASHTGIVSRASVTVESREGPRPSSIGSILSADSGIATLPTQNLGQVMEQLLKIGLPLSVEAVAVVARMVLAAWTWSVETVAWNEGEEGYRLPALGSLPDDMVLR